jgi:hypothetical protein
MVELPIALGHLLLAELITILLLLQHKQQRLRNVVQHSEAYYRSKRESCSSENSRLAITR